MENLKKQDSVHGCLDHLKGIHLIFMQTVVASFEIAHENL